MVLDSNNTLDVLGWYSSHSFDQHEPFVAIGGSNSVRAQVGRLETGHSTKLADATDMFGIYFTRLEPEEEGPSFEDQGISETPRDACKV